MEMMLQSHHRYHPEGLHLDKKGAIAVVVGYGETWRDMARPSTLSKLCRWRLAHLCP